MPRLRFIEEHEKSDRQRQLIEDAKRTGAPDPRVVSIFSRTPIGLAWVEFWGKVLYGGVLPHKLKEMCRIHISMAHQCGYCSTVRSIPAQEQGLTEDLVRELRSWRTSGRFSAREKAALEYAELFKSGDHAIDSDAVYDKLKQHFSDEEIIELGMLCAQTDGVGKLAKSMNIVSWDEACAINPALAAE
jgi:AhpD family alkylhydroperoxidase